MTAFTARGLTKIELERRGVNYLRMKGKKVDFSDLARGSAIYVTIYFEHRPTEGLYASLMDFATAQGFFIIFSFPGCIN